MPNVLSLHIGALGIDGGVGQVALRVVEAIAGAHDGEPWPVRALSLLGDGDTESLRAATSIRRESSSFYRGFGGSRPKFAAASIAAAVGWADVVFVDHLHLAPVAFAAAAIARAPKMLFAHGVEICGGGDDLDRPTRRPTRVRLALLPRFDAIASNSAWTARLVQHVAPRAPTPRVCALSPRDLSSDTNITRADRPTALMVGRMSVSERYKGHREVFDAWPGVLARVPTAQLRVVGGGDDVAALREEIASRGLGDSIAMLGRIDDAGLAREYATAHLFVMPSRAEGFGLVYAEAALCGLPSVAHDPGPAREILVPGVTGWLVDGRDRAAISRAIGDALSDLPATLERGRRARDHVATTFTPAAFARSLRAVIARVAQGNA